MTDFGAGENFDWGKKKAGHQENLGEAKPLQDFPDAPPEFYEEMKKGETNEEKVFNFEDFNVKINKDFLRKLNLLQNLEIVFSNPEDAYLDMDEAFENVTMPKKWILLLLEKNNPQDNFFLKNIAQQVYSGFDTFDQNQHVSEFEITEGLFSWRLENDVIRISKKEDFETIQELFRERTRLREKIRSEKKEEQKFELEINLKDVEYRLEYLTSSKKLTVKDLCFNTPKKEDKEDFKYFMSFLEDGFQRIAKNDFDLNTKKLSISEQFRFFQFIKNHTVSEMNPVIDFSHKFKEVGIKTFLSIEHGSKEMGDKILALGEKLPQESAGILFQTYSAMVDATDDVEQLLQDNLKEKTTPELIQETKNSLLVSGKKLLENYADKISVCEGEDCQKIAEDLKDKLSLAKRSVFAFSSTCKTLVEKGNFSFEDFQKAKLYYERAPLAENIKSQIIAMHTENTKQYPDALREKWRETLRDGLEKENNKQLVVYVQYEDNVVSAMRILQKEDGSSYGASFNVNPTIQGSKVGSELLKKVLFDLAKDKPFIADCYSKNPMLQTYLNTFGFQITKEIENYENTGELVYEITLFPQKEN